MPKINDKRSERLNSLKQKIKDKFGNNPSIKRTDVFNFIKDETRLSKSQIVRDILALEEDGFLNTSKQTNNKFYQLQSAVSKKSSNTVSHIRIRFKDEQNKVVIKKIEIAPIINSPNLIKPAKNENLAVVDTKALPFDQQAAWHFYTETSKDSSLFNLFSGHNTTEKMKHRAYVAEQFGKKLIANCTSSTGFNATLFHAKLSAPITQEMVKTLITDYPTKIKNA